MSFYCLLMLAAVGNTYFPTKSLFMCSPIFHFNDCVTCPSVLLHFLNWGFFIMREAQLGSKVHYFCSDYPRLKKKKRWCVIASGPSPTSGIEHEQRVVRKLDYPCSCWYFYIYEFTWWDDDYLPLENVVYLKNILVVIFWSVLNGYLSLKLDFP